MEKPKIKLTNLENIAIETPAQEIFNRIMRVCECGEWKLNSNKLPTESSHLWKVHRKETLVVAQNPLMYGSKSGSTGERYRKINENKFYEIENIILEQRNQIENYFKEQPK